MKVLLTGAGGFVGSHVLDMLWKFTDWDIVALDQPLKLPRERERITTTTFSFLPGIKAVDVVISMAATADPRKALLNPALAYTNDVQVMVNTMEYARQVGSRVLHVSTNEVYGTKTSPPYEPKGPYAGGKACQEIICGTYDDVPTTIVVTQSLFGERQQPNKLVPTTVRSILAREPVTLQGSRDGWARRPFLHAQNLAESLLLLAQRESTPPRVHVGSDRLISVRDVAETLADALGREALIETVLAGDRPGHEVEVQPIGCDIEGWEPSYDTTVALRDTARWYYDNPDWLR